MEKEGDWFRLLTEHTRRQSDLARFQIMVSFGLSGFIWSGNLPADAILLLSCIYLFCAIYITLIIYRIQDRRLTLWRILAIKENLDSQILDKHEGLFRGLANLFRPLNSCSNEADPKKIQAKYIEKIKPSKKRLVFCLHVLANISALSIVLLYIIYDIKSQVGD
jgi:hypothetical protein